MHTALEGNDNFGSPVQTASPFESIWIFTAWKINGWFTYKKSPMKRKENDLNQTFMMTCSIR